mgnify:CR=1 FL=1
MVGIAKALEWTYTGRVFPAQEALEGGLVSKILPPDDLIPHARALAREIADNTSPVSIALTRQMLWRMLGANHPMEGHKLDSRGVYSRSLSGDSREGSRSFLEKRPPHIVKGTAVFLTSDPGYVPTALLHNLKHNKVLHEHNVILTVHTAETPRVDLIDRVRMENISDKFTAVRLNFGFMETPNVPKALAVARKLGWQFDIMSTSFFVSRRSLKPAAQSGMPKWQDHLFIAMSRSANDATDYFQIPTGRVVEVGTQVTI